MGLFMVVAVLTPIAVLVYMCLKNSNALGASPDERRVVPAHKLVQAAHQSKDKTRYVEKVYLNYVQWNAEEVHNVTSSELGVVIA